MILCDIYVNMDVVTAPGTTLTPTILNAGIQGTSPTDYDSSATAVTPVPATGLTVGIHRVDMKDIVKVRSTGTQYIPGSASKTIEVDGTHPNIACEIWDTSGTHTKFTQGGYVFFGPANAGAGSQLWDLWKHESESASLCVMQLHNGLNPNDGSPHYGIGLETNPGGTTTHSANNITLTPGTLYWCAKRVDYATGQCRLAAYIVGGGLVGEITAVTDIDTSVATFSIGNAEEGSLASTIYYAHTMIDYTALWPFPESNVPPWRTGRMSAVQRMT